MLNDLIIIYIRLYTLIVYFNKIIASIWGQFHCVTNWEETQARPHFRFVSMNFSAFVHCSSELNCILQNQ